MYMVSLGKDFYYHSVLRKVIDFPGRGDVDHDVNMTQHINLRHNADTAFTSPMLKSIPSLQKNKRNQ